ncbi:MAG: hypothetical protein A2600_08545 [Candidatus Lambdaproteobacteria bacterium RIFOXYD1_FULL_56_27]|uniref:Ribonuclease n=1 Tax=Candidatus Lambdaproteobacteria bacterium RIFOXYD2_FULL_56_26 TaxID=1817773 RepID=A0A1F6GMA0_9PROT|nr:MAG: hypothetical protein A2557_10285 [Candidatus Lambdaproteobacteria bacterium RIFOXYD2_FULL_56_26]OGH01792.1 MAG: hypothetical protein A2426_14200 [Candidatus Lambdaproteobacteria bacterium RIFOXYC1_FULL_56_13]OGH07942.1 MAG: hypothetical protein A2600_08545 [Candidatus Lambdaproteobacteria bacterium RIFOXYD1_FULL_56_27]
MNQRLGIDEAGRGPVLGPLVMAGLCVTEAQLPELAALGVQDSKLFGSGPKAQAKRAALAEELKGRYPHFLVVADSLEVDRWVGPGEGLNALERHLAAQILARFPQAWATLDGAGIFAALTGPRVVAQNRADQDFLEVAGASILAKDWRDKELDRLLAPHQTPMEPIRGGGYANEATLGFVLRWLDAKGQLPPFYRQSFRWAPVDQRR